MKALVIPDVHLKPYMFKEAAEWMRKGVADRAVCLMDIPDDWNREYDIVEAHSAEHAAQQGTHGGAHGDGAHGDGQGEEAHVQRAHGHTAQTDKLHHQFNGHQQGHTSQSLRIGILHNSVFLLLPFRPFCRIRRKPARSLRVLGEYSNLWKRVVVRACSREKCVRTCRRGSAPRRCGAPP